MIFAVAAFSLVDRLENASNVSGNIGGVTGVLAGAHVYNIVQVDCGYFSTVALTCSQT